MSALSQMTEAATKKSAVGGAGAERTRARVTKQSTKPLQPQFLKRTSPKSPIKEDGQPTLGRKLEWVFLTQPSNATDCKYEVCERQHRHTVTLWLVQITRSRPSVWLQSVVHLYQLQWYCVIVSVCLLSAFPTTSLAFNSCLTEIKRWAGDYQELLKCLIYLPH